MKRVRKVIFWSHLISGVTAGIVIFVMSVTGVLLAFEAQIVRYAEGNMINVTPPGAKAKKLTPQELFAKLKEANPNVKPSGLTISSNPNEAASFALGREGNLYMNPYTGQVTGDGAKTTRAFFHVVEDWHRWLGMSGGGRPVGKAITGFCNALFLILAITGLYIWMPRKFSWQYLKSITMFKSGLKGRARDFNWHNVIGFWSALVLIFLTATALVMSYQWANNLLYTLTGSELPAQQRPPQAQGGNQNRQGRQEEAAPEIPNNLDQLFARAEEQFPNWQAITFRPAQRKDAPVTFSVDEGRTWASFARSQLTVNAATAEVVRRETYNDYNAGRKLRSWFRFIHTGEAFGLPGQFIAGLASLGGAFLVWTGLSLAWRRFRSWKAKRAAKETDSNIEPELISD